ncbi:nickel-responsive transcriptional regulator NikR [Sulfurihydrogenibium sp.]|uniref:nickel-responsive transcriptional regulator NikR n=1 Tax=Sulfurihydrogenibium sp. TaxID=2053621 RepID=UPI00262446CA|nr:nickel-responsive transcriptional regulator NikR [Sulfurihydrogenibium sp.]
MKDSIVRISLSIPKELANFLDNQVLKNNYSSRSEFIRDLLREISVNEEWTEEKDDVIGILTIVYDHHKRELTQKMIDIQHNHYLNVLCSTHIHLDHYNCLEVIIIKGKPQEIIDVSNNISGLNGVKFAKLIKTANIKL